MIDNHLIAIPVYNEERYMESVLDETMRFSDSILVIDDGSTDGTSGILADRQGIDVMTHPENRGYGKSLADAFAFASANGFDWLITMDCDEQHEPACIPLFLEAAAHDEQKKNIRGHHGDGQIYLHQPRRDLKLKPRSMDAYIPALTIEKVKKISNSLRFSWHSSNR